MAFCELIKHIGRKRITTAYEPSGSIKTDKEIVIKMLQDTMSKHIENVADMETIKKFYDNDKFIDKDKKTREDIDNYVQVPDVFRITRDMNGHICGNGVVFSDVTGEKEKQLSNFNTFLRVSSFDSVYLKANKNASLYGVGYYYVEPNNKDELTESPFIVESESLDPLHTYCVYNTDIAPKKIWAVWFNKVRRKDNKYKMVVHVWCSYAEYTIECINDNYLAQNATFTEYPLAFKQIPIIEVQRNEDRIGDSELALSLIKAKSLLFSNRIDDVQQVVDYVYLLMNLKLGIDEVGPDGKPLSEAQKLVEKKKKMQDVLSSRVIELETINPTIPPKIDILKNPLNQREVQTLAEYLDQVINVVVALPDRNTNSANNDTGVANDYKLGFRNLESYSDTVTSFIKKSLMGLIKVMIAIAKNEPDYKKQIGNLMPSDIDIKPQRNKIFSITDSANAYSTLRSAGLNDEDAIKVTEISQDIPETAKRNRAEKEKTQAEQIKQENEQKQVLTEDGITTK